MWCSDPFLSVLKQYGYNVVRLPRTGIRPLQILMRAGSDLDRLGDLTTILLPGPLVPEITPGGTANISGQSAQTGDIAANAGIPLLSNVVAAMGGSRMGLEVKYEKAESVSFEFLDVVEESIQLAALDQFLGQAKCSPNNRQVKKLLEADAVYVLTAVIKSAKLNVSAKSSGGQALNLDVSQLKTVVGIDGKVSVSATDQQSSTIQYAGSEPLVFGFQAVQLIFKDGQFDGWRRLRPQDAAIRSIDAPVRQAAPENAPENVLIETTGTPFVRLREKGDKPARRALLIGIDQYPNLDAQHQLHGCVQDVNVMRETLRKSFGFPAKNIRLLADKRATRKAILDAMDRLVRETGPEDVVFIQYSGHGSQVVDREGDEPDGRDETIVASDSGRGNKPNRDITDDEIFTRLLALSMKTGNITLVFDCCHSGTITRDAFGERGRRLAADDRLDDKRPPASVTPEAIATLKAAHGRDMGPSGLLPRSSSYVLIAGCRDEETSFEHTVVEGEDTITHGALTYYFHQELLKAAPDSTYRDVFDQASPRVSAAYASQHPQLEGAADRELFGTSVRAQGSFVAATQGSGPEVNLAAGAAHGLTVGSRWAVYPPGTKKANPSLALGRVTIARVGALTSTAKPDDGFDPATIAIGAKAAEESHDYGDLRLKVELNDLTTDQADVATTLQTRIKDSPLLSVGGSEADARVYLLPAGEPQSRGGAAPMLGNLEAQTWAIVGRDGQTLTPTGPLGNEDSHSRLLSNLETIARYQNTLAIVNVDPSNILKDKVDLILLRKNNAGEWMPAETGPDRQPVFHAGDEIAFRIVNRHTKPIFATVLDFGLTYRIFQVYPLANSQPAQQKGTFDFGTLEADQIALGIPEGFDRPEGLEIFKLIATTEPSDFGWMQQGAVRDLGRSDLSPLERMMKQALQGTRDAAPLQVPTSEQWTTASRPIILKASGAAGTEP